MQILAVTTCKIVRSIVDFSKHYPNFMEHKAPYLHIEPHRGSRPFICLFQRYQTYHVLTGNQTAAILMQYQDTDICVVVFIKTPYFIYM